MTTLLTMTLIGCGDAATSDAPGAGSGGAGDGGGRYPEATLSPDRAASYTNLSAPNVFAVGAFLMVVASSDQDGCPKKTEQGNQTVYEGGCTTADGDQVDGRAVVTGDPTGGGSIDYQDFGFRSKEECGGTEVPTALSIDGTMTTTPEAAETLSFDVAMVFTAEGPEPESCAIESVAFEYDYLGTVQQQGMDGPSTWNGSGKVGSAKLGSLSASTLAEVLDSSSCNSEALSGKTVIEAGGDRIEYLYDGASDCDDQSTVTWTFNGKDQGELGGVQCAYRPAPSGRWSYLLLAAGSAIGLARRRLATIA